MQTSACDIYCLPVGVGGAILVLLVILIVVVVIAWRRGKLCCRRRDPDEVYNEIPVNVLKNSTGVGEYLHIPPSVTLTPPISTAGEPHYLCLQPGSTLTQSPLSTDKPNKRKANDIFIASL